VPTARDRLARVAAQSGLRIPDDVEKIESWSNDVWRCGDVFVRVCFHGDRARLLREAAIGAALPAEAAYPRVLDYGEIDDMSWMLVERLEGESLHGWRSRSHRELRSLIEQLAGVLRAVHAWPPPPDVDALLQAHARDEARGADATIGHDILPLPYPRTTPLVEAALELPFVDDGLVRAVSARLDELAPHDPFATPADRVVHGDVNFSNLLAHEGRLVALLDYEWARLGPPDGELVQLLRSSRQWDATEPAPPPVGEWVQELYPEMFATPNLRERFWLCELAYMLRQLVLWPPAGNDDEAPWHPIKVLPRLVEAPWEY
jgi:aminoglycoside phosphotransferase (APT) family kinase protein